MMTHSDIDVDALITRHFEAFPDTTHAIDSRSLFAFWNELAPANTEYAAAFEQAVIIQWECNSGQLYARTGGWCLHLKRGLIKAAILSPIVAATLQAAGVTGLPSIILPMVLPFLFEIERTTLSRRHEEILLHLVRSGAARQAHSVDQLYDLLPPALRDEVNRIEFLEFIDALELLRLAREQENREFILSHPNSGIRIKIE
jgi:hypothetical protein